MGKALVLFAGGTLAMEVGRDGALVSDQKPEKVLELLPDVSTIAECDFTMVSNLDSSNMQTEHWVQLATIIYHNLHEYDGFVILHGTDTMAYTASALSFALLGIGKPVVLTGAQKPVTDLSTDAVNNFVNAVKVSQMDMAEVCIVFGTQILRGNRATKQSDIQLDAFRSPMLHPLGEIDLEPHLSGLQQKRHQRDMKFVPTFDNHVLVFQLFPGMEPALLLQAVETDCQGVVLLGFGAGNVPHVERPVDEAIKSIVERGIPVLVTTQCSSRQGSMRAYQAGFDAVQAGAVSTRDMTDEAAITKLMWVLSQTQEVHYVKRMMEKPMCGEMGTS